MPRFVLASPLLPGFVQRQGRLRVRRDDLRPRALQRRDGPRGAVKERMVFPRRKGHRAILFGGNVYTDGSVRRPGSNLSIGSFGFWYPGRQLAAANPEDFFFARRSSAPSFLHDSGIVMAGTILGLHTNSTRTEIAAIIPMLSSQVGLHIGTDSESMASQLQDIIENHTCRRRPWGLRNDGDLWQLIDDALDIRGCSSVKVSWVKGHATIADMLEGRSTPEHAVGNGNADTAADTGIEGSWLTGAEEFLQFMALKRDALIVLTSQIQQLVIRVLKAEKESRLAAVLSNISRPTSERIAMWRIG